MSKIGQLLHEETEGLHLRLLLARLLVSPFPPHTGSRLRAAVLRLAGFRIGHGTLFWGMPAFTGSGNLYPRLTVGEYCWFNIGCTLNLGAEIAIGDRAAIGHQVMILTDSHELGPAGRRAGPVTRQPVRIGAGAWIGARSLILPGVTIGDGAVIAAGAVVNKDVPPNTLAAGVPARPLREL